MNSFTPVIETDRLILRAHKLEDFPILKALWEDPSTVQYTIGKPSTEQQSWGRMMNYRGHWEMMGYGYWAVEEKDTKLYIGELGFADFKRDLTPSIQGLPELGWMIASHVRNKGYATEGVLAAIDWGKTNLPVQKMACIINPKNAASIKVADKCGLTEYIWTEYLGEKNRLYLQDL